jgi:hypothetical protein
MSMLLPQTVARVLELPLRRVLERALSYAWHGARV